MGNETLDWYNRYCLCGFTNKRGYAWHYKESAQDVEPNHYPNAIPVDDVLRRLFYWQAVSGPVETSFYTPDGEVVTIEDATRQAIIRPDTQTIFGIFRDSYQIHQHDEWLIDNAASIIDSSVSDVGIANAVLLKGGAVAAVQYELPENITLAGQITVRPSLLAVGSMDGSLRTGYRSTVVNVVCDNTMSAAISSAQQAYLLKHSKYSDLKVVEAQEALGMLFTIADTFSAEVDKLLSIPVSGAQFRHFLDITAPVKPNDNGNNPLTNKKWTDKAQREGEAKQEKLLNLWVDDERVAPWRGTAYGIWQLNNTYQHHIAATNEGTVRGERNIFNAASGAMHKSDTAALDTLFTKVLQLS